MLSWTRHWNLIDHHMEVVVHHSRIGVLEKVLEDSSLHSDLITSNSAHEPAKAAPVKPAITRVGNMLLT